ncbi:MAG: hypothetical protein ACKOE7_01300, partial [Actinomycetota bacterium]
MVAIRPEATSGDSVDELVAPAGALLPARQLAEHLQSDIVTKSHTVVLDAALAHAGLPAAIDREFARAESLRQIARGLAANDDARAAGQAALADSRARSA